MVSSRLLFFLSAIFMLTAQAVAQPAFRYHHCFNGTGNYTTNSSYETNLNHLLSSISSSTEIDNIVFYNSSYGENSNHKVYSIGVCRGDVNRDVCLGCLINASSLLKQLCPNQKEAIGWYDECMLRYSNRSILGILETSPTFYLWSSYNVSANYVDQFDNKRWSLLENLSQVVAGGSLGKFAVGNTPAPYFQTLYALVQCTPYLSEQDCNYCLIGALQGIPVCCDGKEGGRVLKPSCNIRFEVYQFYDSIAAASTPSSPLAPPLSNTNTTKGSKTNTPRIVIIIVVSSAAFVVLVIISFCIYFRVRRRSREKLKIAAILRVAVLVGLFVVVILRRRRRAVRTGKTVEGSLVAFGYRDLQNATKNFSDKLGGGGFGSVFKGKLSDSTLIAVKKLESISQGEKQFRTEVSTIGTVNHVNLVRLRGFCAKGTRKLLVYDYMPNGSLESHLFHEKFLDWKTRYQIAIGTARGLAYLHDKCRECIIHCDIKPENILLDAYLCPKVADFGLAKLVGREFSRVLTTMRGTRGYLAPEWISGMPITAKADVYSYGMMLFEFVSGRRNSEEYTDGKTNFFPTGAASLMAEGGDVLSLLDPRLEGNADIEELTRVCKVACWCIQDDDTNRPPMGQVVQMLEGVLDVNLAPIPNSLQVLFADNQEHIDFYTESHSSQSS